MSPKRLNQCGAGVSRDKRTQLATGASREAPIFWHACDPWKTLEGHCEISRWWSTSTDWQWPERPGLATGPWCVSRRLSPSPLEPSTPPEVWMDGAIWSGASEARRSEMPWGIRGRCGAQGELAASWT